MGTAAIIREQLIKTQKYLEKKEKAAADPSKAEPEFNMKCEALIPLLKRQVKAHFHCHRADDIYTAIRIGREFHLDYILVHCTEGHLIAEDIAKEGVPAICGPLLTTRSKPELTNSTKANPGVLAKAGVLTAICTDHDVIPMPLLPTSAGFAVGEEWTMSRRCALSPSTRRKSANWMTESARWKQEKTQIFWYLMGIRWLWQTNRKWFL